MCRLFQTRECGPTTSDKLPMSRDRSCQLEKSRTVANFLHSGSRGGVAFNTVTKEVEFFPRVDGTYEMTMHIPPAALVEAAAGCARQGA